MAKKPNKPCAGRCGRLLWTGRTTRLDDKPSTCRECRAKAQLGRRANQPAKFRLVCQHCSSGFNARNSVQLYCSHDCWRAVERERNRARLRHKSYLRRMLVRISDITPEYEADLRAAATACPTCNVDLVDTPFLPASKELDHIVPLNVGGTHTIGNVRIICRGCNLRRPLDGSDYTGQLPLWAVAA